jgi:hypothetical protein
MIYASIILFAIAAMFGLTILIRWLIKKDAPAVVIYSHGIFAVIAFLSLLVYSLQNKEHFPLVSLILFAIVAVAGFIMFFMNLKNSKSPLFIAFIHAIVAVTAIILLLLFAIAF